MSIWRQYYWRMSDNNTPPPDAFKTRDELATLSARVYRAIEHGAEIALDFFSGDERRPDPWLFSHLVRYGALEELDRLPGGARSIREEPCITRNPMCGVEILYQEKVIRVFKKPPAEDEFLQPPGESERRQDFYDQRQKIVPGTEGLFKRTQNLVYVWDQNGGSVDLWLVKPFGFEEIWQAGNVQWSIPIPHPATQVSPATDFTDTDEPLDIDLDETGSEDDPDDGA